MKSADVIALLLKAGWFEVGRKGQQSPVLVMPSSSTRTS